MGKQKRDIDLVSHGGTVTTFPAGVRIQALVKILNVKS